MASKVSGVIEYIQPGGSSGTKYAIAATAYGVCDTAANEPIKNVDMTGFKLQEGMTVHIKFINANFASNPKLKFNSEANTNAKPIVQYGTTAVGITEETNGWYDGAVLTLTYDGTSWVRDQDNNTWRDIQDNLTSDSTTDSLSAKQGKVLKGLIDAMDASTPAASGNATAFIDSITQTDGKITSITKKNIPTASTSTAGIIKIGTTANDAAAGNHNHDSTYSYIHLTNYDFTDTQPLSKYVTFDKSRPVGAPKEEWYNGFISSHGNYLASYIINGHTHSDEWYVGHGIWREANTPHATAPTWYLLAHSGNVSTGDNNGQVKIAGQNINVKGLKALAYKDSLTYSDIGAAPAVTGGYLPLSGGQMIGPLTWKNSTALPEAISSEYFLVIDSFANGGTTKWIGKANALTSLGAAASNHNHNGAYVPNTSGANDVNTLVNTGIYNITSGSLTNGPTGYGFGQLLVMSYRKHTDNTTTDWATQIYAHLGSGNNGNTLYYRTSNASTWQTWQMVAHADAGTALGGAKKPIYITAQGVITEGDAIGASAYHNDSYFALALHGNHVPDYPANNTSAYFLRGDNTWSNALGSPHSKSIATFNAINGSDNAWNKSGNYNLRLSANNNCLVITVGGILNDRNAYIQVGHSDTISYANITGNLYLNKFGGQVYINTNIAARHTTTPVTGEILIADGTTGGIKTSGYTIATSVPANAVFTDHYAWSDITNKPTTLSGYGITDAASSSHSHTLKIGNKSLSVSTSEQKWNVHDILYNSDHNIGTNTSWDITEPGVYSVASSGAFTGEQHPGSNGNQSAPYTYGHAFTIRAHNGGASQFYINHNASESKHSSRGIRYRSGWNVINNPDANHWRPWATILDDKNFNLYAPTLTGTGASGSWSISITGTAAKATADASGNTITSTYAPLASPALTGTPTAPTAANGTNTTQIATTAFVNNTLSYVNAMRFKGTLGTGGTVTALPASHEAGDTYRVITADTWAGQYCEEGTLIICVKDGTAASNDDWTSVETNEDGAVIGPSTATDNGIVLFSGNTGRIIKNSSKTLTTTAPSTDSGDTTIPTSKAVWTTVNTAITGLDFTAIGGDTGEYISKISQTDGKISATKATTSVSNTWTAGTTAGPTIKTTVNGIAGTAVAVPSASNTASGVITTGDQTFAGIKTFANTTASTSTDTGAVLVSGGLGVTGQVTAARLAANGSNTSYNLYVNGTSYLNGNTTVNGNLIPGANNTKTLGSTSARWSKLYIGSADNHGDAYTPIYWDDGAPTAVTPVQYCEFTINNGKTGVRLTHNAFTENSYVLQIVVTSGESNLNSAIEWESSSEGYIDLTCSATSGDVQGYILVSRGGALSQVASEDLPLAEET